jgi:hypothetical protein
MTSVLRLAAMLCPSRVLLTVFLQVTLYNDVVQGMSKMFRFKLRKSDQRRGEGDGETPFLNLFLYDDSVAAGGHVVPKSCPSTDSIPTSDIV